MMFFRCCIPVFSWYLPVLFLFSGELAAQEGLYDETGKLLSPQEKTSYGWVDHFFEEDEPVTLEIRSDFKALMNDDTDDPDYRPALISMQPAGPYTMKMNVRIRPRGYSRRMACPLPPLKVDFSHSGTALKQPKKLQEVKLVAVCRKGETFQHYVLREYLLYKFYNLLTPLSFRVRLAKTRYVDAAGDSLVFEGWAFMIEDVDNMAKRNQGAEIEDEKLHPRDLNREYMTQVAIFQFMIVNLDWSVSGLHNLKVVERDGELFPVPYDFDYAEMVGAFYASEERDPNLPELPSQRIYQGYCCSRANLNAVLDRFRRQRESMIGLTDSFNYLPAAEREEVMDLLHSFFRLIERPAQIETYFINNCRN